MFILYILSTAFQIAGALLLMINSLSTRRDRVIRRFAGNGIIHKDNNTNKLSYNKDAFRETFKEAYLNKCAFLFIAIGYSLGIFGNLEGNPKCLALIIIYIATAAIMTLTYFIINLIIKNKKEINNEITSSELEKLGIKPDTETISNELIDALIDSP